MKEEELRKKEEEWRKMREERQKKKEEREMKDISPGCCSVVGGKENHSIPRGWSNG